MTTDEPEQRQAPLPAESSAEAAASLSIEVEYADRVNFAMQQNGVPLLERVALTNVGEDPTEQIVLTITLANGECEPWTGRIDRIDPGSTFHIEPDGLRLDARQLATRTEAERTSLDVSVVTNEGSVSKSLPVDLLAFDQWPGVGLYPGLLAAFVTPNHPKVAELLSIARTALGELSGRDALDGYQSGSRTHSALIAEACFNAVLTRGIGYVNPPASFDREGQRVRLVDRILRENLGSCLDLSLLLASLWEQVGLYPLVLLLEGHAMPAVWTRETHLPEPAIDEAARIRNLIALGNIVPVESTLLTHRGASFAAAVDAAKRRMESPGSGFCAIDIQSGRKRGVRPLPLRAEGSGTEVDLNAIEADGPPAIAGTSLDRVVLADRVEGRVAREAGSSEQEPDGDRIDRWKTRLLDLSLRNRLINFKETGRTIRLLVPDVARLEDMLAEDAQFSIYPKTSGNEEYLRQEIEARHLYTPDPPAETQKRLLQLYRTARSSIEETGANLLHVAIGMLKWFETESSETPRYAPLILLPAQLDRRSTGSGYGYDVQLTNEPLRPNVTLLEKLRRDFGVKTDGLEDLPEDEHGLDVPLILRNFRSAIGDTSRWEVEESVYLGLYSFNKFLMWLDLQQNMERLRQSRLVTHLVDGAQDTFDTEPFPSPEDLDDQVSPGELLCTRDADSTQLAAIRAAADGRTFVLEGPPGTGKSQTIANIIADSLGRGKRVLFVAEKMAALSVVRRRLAEDGLDPFCLELHSAKASKKEVLAQLRKGLDAASMTEPPDFPKLCEEVGLTRDELNTYVRELHRPRPTGESLFQVLGRISLLSDGPRVAVPNEDVTATTKDRLDGWRRQIDTLVEQATAIDPPHRHPLRGVGRSVWSFDLPQEVSEGLTAASDSFRRLCDRLTAFLAAVGNDNAIQVSLGRDGVLVLARIARQLLQCPTPDRRLLIGSDSSALLADLRQLVEIGKERDRRQEDLLGRYREEFLDLDHLVHLGVVNRAAGRPGLLRTITGFMARRKFRPYCKERVPDLATLQADLETAREVKQHTSDLEGADEAARVLGRRWKGGKADWAELEQILGWCAAFHESADLLLRHPDGASLVHALAVTASEPATAVEAAKMFVGAWNAWAHSWETVKTLLTTTGSEAFGAGLDTGWLAQVDEILPRWTAAIGDLNDWCAWRRARAAAVELGLVDLVERYERGELQRDELADAFERSFAAKWFNGVANMVNAIRGFNANAHNKSIARFRAIDQALIDDARYAVGARLSKDKPSGSSHVSGKSELGILRRQLEKKSRHLPTRKLIEALPNLLPRLKPCFLMSPLSVAQYLNAKLPPFDLVVFDEASQIPVWDSIGAIARGRDVIVVGDSKQLPPTSFFDIIDGEDESGDEDFAMEDMESILKECNASGIPPMQLRWHYRSRHESLIAFSNHHYYENRLHTFPSPVDRCEDLGVTFRHVRDGVYDRGVSRTNRVEASAVVEEVVRLLGESEKPDSIGVVTFNQAQQSLIEDLLDAKRREMAEIELFFTNEVLEPVFVKNLENVQGDERDTVIFSVGYGPDRAGRPSMNFGPLNKEGGERRLNVAITRARRRLIVFSSLRSDQIDLRRTQSVGVRHFKTFLDYAARGPQAIAEAIDYSSTRDFESGFERAVWKALTDRGWEVDCQIGCAGYRVDLAIRDAQRPGRYLIGIECDGAAYHSAKTARDRDRLRQSVLEGLGWRIERVWSTQWRINPDRCIESIEQAIDDAKRGMPAASAPNPGTPDEPVSRIAEVELKAEPAGPPPYRRATPSSSRFGRLDIFDRSSTTAAVEAFVEIVKVEGPIVDELVVRRVAEWFDDQRVTNRFRTRLAEVRAAALRTQPIKVDQDVLWPADIDPASFTIVRVPGPTTEDRRDLEDIPLIERVNAVVHILNEQFGLPREDLERETARLLGMHRLTARVSAAITEAIESAIQQGRAVSRDGHVSAAAT